MQPEEQGVGPFTWGAQSEHLPPPNLPKVPIGGSVYQQPGTKVDGSCHSKEGFQVSKGDKERGQKGISKGSKKQGDCAIYIL